MIPEGNGVALAITDLSLWQLLALFQRELLLFAGVFFLLGAIDDIAMDIGWLWLKLTGRALDEPVVDGQQLRGTLRGEAAVFIPAWQESQVIGHTITHILDSWPHAGLRLYIGCYPNDAATIEAVIQAAPDDRRLRLVVLDHDGPTTKADCLNRLYLALCEDEARSGFEPRMVVFHDAEDMVDPAALNVLDDAIGPAQFVQLPVLPVPQSGSRWLGSHYCEEFAEAHGKTMVVRDALGAALPAAGVGFAVEREALARLALDRGTAAPFEATSLTEDYELGLAIADLGGKCRFVRKRRRDGELIATRAYFPARLDHIVKQKTRWVHGISFQGWDRLGWNTSGAGSGVAEIWMRARDRRGPMTALVLFAGYFLLAISTLVWGASELAGGTLVELGTGTKLLLAANFGAFLWRIAFRFGFTASEYGVAEGLRALMRVPVANIIAIMAGRRAFAAYVRTLGGAAITWEKTPHFNHPTRQGVDGPISEVPA